MQNVQDVVALEFEKHSQRLDRMELLSHQVTEQNVLIKSLSGKLTVQSTIMEEMQENMQQIMVRLNKEEGKTRELNTELEHSRSQTNQVSSSG